MLISACRSLSKVLHPAPSFRVPFNAGKALKRTPYFTGSRLFSTSMATSSTGIGGSICVICTFPLKMLRSWKGTDREAITLCSSGIGFIIDMISFKSSGTVPTRRYGLQETIPLIDSLRLKCVPQMPIPAN
ncbi:hypothetical protein BJY00DRAFT_287342 [Aspergillus carlsbadensis]|nr:hypothetical protein BJY00DRAFT_287342 [Aspergillus carlsbadensis]